MLRVLYKLQIHVCCLAPRYRNICQSVCLSAYVRLHVCIDSPTLHKEPPNTAGLFYWVRGDSPCRKVRVLQHVRRLRRQSKAPQYLQISATCEWLFWEFHLFLGFCGCSLSSFSTTTQITITCWITFEFFNRINWRKEVPPDPLQSCRKFVWTQSKKYS